MTNGNSDTFASVVTRNAFYRDSYTILLKVAVLEAIIIIAMVLTLMLAVAMTSPEDRYFATSADGSMIRLVPLEQPNLSDATVLSWASRAAEETMSFGFSNYQRELQESSAFFTDSGWRGFQQALRTARTIDKMKAYSQLLTATVTGAPVLLDKRRIGDAFVWRVQFPLLITYQSFNTREEQQQLVILVIRRRSTLENPMGIGIHQWVAKSG
ncbi:MAG: type IVB secretion system apparatus protein IcmL/DotI [Pseudomonadota bacterium]|nr:type IVB secretion system apparatus protein IcmL/DotI [Pseudomonadota bacterium]